VVTLPILGTRESFTLNPSKIIALGLNYADHVRESVSAQAAAKQDLPVEPILFAKTPNVLIGPDEPIRIPKIIDGYKFDDPRTDYEAELAFIIGKKCCNVSEKDALSHIMGYTCMNDVSQRNIQLSDKSGWFRGKSFDSFGPVGPVIVPAARMANPMKLKIECRLNGRTVQSARTSDMIFSIPVMLAFISRQITLLPGDIVTTGTPSGVGRIKPGDVVEIEIEQIGVLRNPVEAG
jgi:2-keto-4-pentenoate hydratase/2-oxohepta-3-ene-1,7-dioic acid hydratase in catechol pathway